MKKYTKKNWYMLVIACMLGALYAAYLLYEKGQGLDSAAVVAIGVLLVLVAAILWWVRRFLMDRGSGR